MEKRQTFDFWSLRRPKELSDCGRSSPAFESLGRQFEPARAERTSSSGLAEAGESQNCLSRKRGRKTIKRGLRVSRPLVLEKNGGEFLFHSHFFALSLAPVVSLSPGSHLVRARSLFLSFLPSLVRTQHPHLRAAACFRKAISKVVPEEGASRQTIALASAFERSSNRSQGILLSLSLTPFPSPPPLSLCTPSLSTNKHQQHAQRPHRGHGHRCALLRLFLGHEDGDDDDDKARRSPILGRFVSGASPLAPGLLLRSLHALRAPRVRR